MHISHSEFIRISIPIVFCCSLTILAVVRNFEYRLQRQLKSDYESQVVSKGESTFVEGVLLHHPYESGGLQVLELANLRVYTSPYPKYRFGDRVRVETTKCNNNGLCYHPGIFYIKDSGPIDEYAVFSEFEPKDKAKPRLSSIASFEFNSVDDSSFLSVSNLFKTQLYNEINELRGVLVKRVRSQLPEPHASLVLGMTIGFKEDYPNDFKEVLIISGVMHVIVVSGYNVALILGFISKLLIRFGKIVYFLSSSLILILFIFLVGLDPPVVRAGIMGFIAVVATIAGRERNAIYILVIISLVLLIVNPAYLNSLSFQMSIIATTAVLVSSILIPDGLYVSNFVKDLIILIMVNLALLPVISYNFGRLSLVSVPVNLLITWIIPLVTILGFLLMVLPNIVVSVIIIALIDYFILICNLFATINYASIDYQMSIKFYVFYYIVVLFVLRLVYLFIIKVEEIE